MMTKEFSLEKKTGIIISVIVGAILLFFILKVVNTYVFNKNTYYILFDNVSLIQEEAPVYIDNAVVGYVKKLSLSSDRKKVIVKVKILKNINIPDRSIAEITSTDPAKRNKVIRITLFSSVKYLADHDTLFNIPSRSLNMPETKAVSDTLMADTTKVIIPDTLKKAKVMEKIPEKVNAPLDKKPVITQKKEVTFRVQFLVSKKEYPADHEVFKGIKGISKINEGGVFKYMAGDETDKSSAVAIQTEVRNKGFGDAFIVVIKDGVRLSGNDAKKYLNK